MEQRTAAQESEVQLNQILRQIYEASDFAHAVEKCYPDIMRAFDAERVTVYQIERYGDDLVSRFKVADQLKEIRVAFSVTSIAGFCALSRKLINIGNVRNDKELKAIHPRLSFQDSFDKASGFVTKAMLVAPILHQDTLLGVIQVINRKDGGEFNETHKFIVTHLARLLGHKLHQELKTTTDPFGLLLERGRLSKRELDDLKKRAQQENTSVAQLLIQEFGISRTEIGSSLERFYHVPYMGYDPNLALPKELFQGIQEAYFFTSGWIPIGGDRNSAMILIDDPANKDKISEIQRVINAKSYTFRLGMQEDILRYLGVDLSLTLNTSSDKKLLAEVAPPKPTLGKDIAEADEAIVVHLVNKCLVGAHLDHASDIHIEPAANQQPTAIRYRIDGDCRLKERVPAELHPAIVSRIKILSRLDISEHRLPQDGKFAVNYKGAQLEFRVAIIPTVHGESVTLRLLTTASFLSINELNIAEHYQPHLKKLLNSSHGLFLVAGPTGSGKTTTLHSVLNQLNTEDRKIWTAEDPVEITQPGLQQVQVQPKIGFTFAKAMRAFLRGDPDVIMVGEMRDQETATIGIEASLTGHIVFSTLHSNSAPEAVTRLIDLGVERANFADALLGVLSQRLMRRLCPHCKEPVLLNANIWQALNNLYGADFERDCGHFRQGSRLVYRPKGCNDCQGIGYQGRIGIHEMLIASSHVKRLIAQGASTEQLESAACEAGMRTLSQDRIYKTLSGDLNIDDLLPELAKAPS